ncbi:Protein of unknown function DUF5131 [uncultured Caudovirales phage]|uniref:Uncharacterized protein n=1 Tax=uncultured Caudovirales phage TaxID=2100421 RepID=A0A6J5RMR5_9CAUD|nr:Protein of unknown function DUF5131 [uncultured Caudovirales phage]CAB4195557.1 Protein of unknown function DUF5131 [uncultured Caudovirales phage]CAB4222548.1 Protein of unknown function DUF5131 [uncultured Caudovirales phage]
MSDKTSIEWCTSTWNPVRGCSRVSPGCGGPNHQGGCYAEKIAARFSGPGQAFEGFAKRTAHGGAWTGKMAVVWDLVDQPIRWRKPRRIFANSMSDLFHKDLPRDEVAIIYGTAIAAVHLRGHTIQILTKRADHMRETLNDATFWEIANAHAESLVIEHTDPLDRRKDDARATLDDYGPDKPPPGIWHGVSVEDQPRADERIPHLLATPAAIRFLSCEPLLGPLDIARYLGGLNWTITGGESGPAARPAHPDWFRSLRDQCLAAEVPFFFKQWGEWAPGECTTNPPTRTERTASLWNDKWDFGTLTRKQSEETHTDDAPDLYRLGKKVAGAMLDGREWREFPI